jgi:hypothetical protein
MNSFHPKIFPPPQRKQAQAPEMGTYRPRYTATDGRILGDTDFHIRDRTRSRKLLEFEAEVARLKKLGKSEEVVFEAEVARLKKLGKSEGDNEIV